MGKSSLSKHRFDFKYSIAILIVIPMLILASAVLVLGFGSGTVDEELYRGALRTSDVFNSGIKVDIEDKELVQDLVNDVFVEDNQIVGATVLYPGFRDNLVIGASSLQDTIGRNGQSPHLTAAVAAKTPSAVIVDIPELDIRLYRVFNPIFNENNELKAVSVIDTSLVETDDNLLAFQNKSFFVILGVVAITVLLLLNHFKFIDYSQMFKKHDELEELESDFLKVTNEMLKGELDKTKLREIAANLKEVSEIEKGLIELELEHVTLNNVIVGAVKKYRKQASDKGLKLKFDEPDATFIVEADREKLQKVIGYLVQNAIDQSNKDTIHLASKVVGSSVVTSIEDTGQGLSKAQKMILFKKFHRPSKKSSDELGTRLWLTRQYLELMGGTVYSDDGAHGGSRLVFSLDLIREKNLTG